MSTTQLLWTAIPNGQDSAGKRLRFSVFLTPRLAPDGVLGNFALGIWPDRMQTAKFAVEFSGGPTLDAAIEKSVLRSDVWQAMFPVSTPVKGYAFPPHAFRQIRSFPVRPLNAFITTLYGALASNPTTASQYPSVEDGSPLGGLIEAIGRIPELARRAKTQTGGPEADAIVLRQLGNNPVLVSYYQAWRFYNRGNQAPVPGAEQPDKGPIPPLVPVPEFDFHQAVGALGDHPALLRMLGLILDFTVPAPAALNVPPPTTGKLRIRNLAFDGVGAIQLETPWTAYEIKAEGIIPQAAPGSDIADRMLTLGNKDKYEIMQIDVDGASLHTLDYAHNIRRFKNEAVATKGDAPKNASVPALRTNGFTVARVDRATRSKQQLINAVAHNTLMSDTTLRADDLLRGFRVDVEWNGGWYSLCRRRAKYNLPGVEPITVEDEGYVKGSASTSNPDGNPMNDMYLHEALFGWDGWSLVAVRPGRAVENVSDPVTRKQTQVVRNIPNKPAPTSAFKLEPEIHAQPGSLPRLRFGRSYRFRARAVDVAGNSVALNDALPGTAWRSEERTYLRWEPLATPALVYRAPISLGEQIENMVIRTKSNPATPANPIFNDVNERHIAPPKTTQFMAETHGAFDGITDAKVSYRIAIKEKGTFQDRKIVDESTGAMVDVSNVELHKQPPPAPMDPPLVWPMPGQPLQRGEYVIHTGDEIKLPYLPDVIARGVTFAGFPTDNVIKIPYEGGWPTPKTFRLSLVAGGAEGSDTDGRNLTLKLPPGSIVKIRYGSFMDPDDLKVMAVWRQMSNTGRAMLAGEAADGLHYMLTPWRELQLVHAVEQPLEDPVFQDVDAFESSKQYGQTFSLLGVNIKNHSHSTGQMSIHGSWIEIEDRLGEKGPPVPEVRSGHVADVTVLYEQNPFIKPDLKQNRKDEPLKHEFGDTKHRLVKYRATATTRFLEYFPPEIQNDPKLITRTGPDSVEVNILSTVRPEPPQVLYIVPTFKWDPPEPGATSRKRVGRGLRVYLDRPWYGTGVGEKLGVVLPNATSGALSPSVRRYISEWGADPVYDSIGPSNEMAPEHFPNAAVAKAGLTLAEDEAQTVRAVGFDVEFNEERQLWFADLELDPGNAYWPYVRLALSRLQPDSIPNAHLSRVVRTEFSQLVADRSATIQARADGWIDVTVVGLSASTKLGRQLPTQPNIVIPPIGQLPGRGDIVGPPSPQQLQKVFDAVTETENRGRAQDKASDAVIGPVTGPVVGPQRPDLLPNINLFIRSPDAGDGHSVRVHIERRDAGTKGDLGWERHSDDVVLDSFIRLLSPETFWRGSIRRLPRGQSVARSEFRLVIREFELYDTDRTTDARPPVYNPARTPIGERLVYLDVFPLGDE